MDILNTILESQKELSNNKNKKESAKKNGHILTDTTYAKKSEIIKSADKIFNKFDSAFRRLSE